MTEILSPEKDSVEVVRQWTTERGIELAIFDLDDTLIETNHVVGEWFDKALCMVNAKMPDGKDIKEVKIKFKEEQGKLYDRYHNHPRIWGEVFKHLRYLGGYEFIDDDLLARLEAHFAELYHMAPALVSGASEVVTSFKNAKVPMCVLTHSNPAYAMGKVWRHETLRPLLGNIYPVDPSIEKGVFALKALLTDRKVDPKKTVYIGDSLRNDVIPAHQVGINEIFWINKGKEWPPVGGEVVPNGVHKIAGIWELIDAMKAQIGM